MIWIALGVCGLLAVAILSQAVLIILFARAFYRPQPPAPPDDRLPKVAVLLSLRGLDPGLTDHLQALMGQDYPSWELRIVVDHREDPAWEVVHSAIQETGAANVKVSSLTNRRNTCSLKCSALVQMVSDLDETIEVVAQVDADVHTHRTWLRELVNPLIEEGAGATFGNVWYMPREARWGSLVRYLWSAIAITWMYFMGLPWAGTFAIRRSLLRESGLVGKWSQSVVEDTQVTQALAPLKVKPRFVPSLMMLSRSEYDWSANFEYMQRLLFWTRTYHRGWAIIVVHSVSIALLLVAALAVALAGVVTLRYGVAALAGGGLLGYLLCSLVLIGVLEMGVRRSLRARDEETRWLSMRVVLRLTLAVALTQGTQAAAVLGATFKRRVVWRGVTYLVRGPYDIEMLDYQPWRSTD